MPMVSQAQRKFLHATNPEVAEEFEAKTPKGKKLPKHVKGSKSPVAKAKGAKAKAVAKAKVRAENAQESATDPGATLKPRKVERDVLEFRLQDKPCKVDREKGIIYGVHLCGPISKNGGRWPQSTLEAALNQLDGAKCNINHPDRDKPGKDRMVADRFGVYHNPTVTGVDGAYADLHFLKTHPLAEMVCESAERMPEALGFSINARTIQTPGSDGNIIHESITRVRSVDLVADPATTSSIFESENMNDPHTQGEDQREQDEGDEEQPEGGNMGSGPGCMGSGPGDGGDGSDIEHDPIDLTIDALLEKYLPDIKTTADKASRRTLLNNLKSKIDAVITALIDEPEPEGEGEEEVEEEEEKPEPGSEGSEGEPKGGGTEGDTSEKKEAQESVDEKPVTLDYDAALDVLESANIQTTKARVKALMAVPVTDRDALISSWPKVGVPASDTKASPDYEAALDVLESAKVQPTKIRIKTLLAVPAEDRDALVASWPKAGSSSERVKPKSSSVLESSRQDQANKTEGTTPEQLKDDAMLLFSAS